MLFTALGKKTSWRRFKTNEWAFSGVAPFVFYAVTTPLIFNFIAEMKLNVTACHWAVTVAPFAIHVIVMWWLLKGMEGKTYEAAYQSSLHPSFYLGLPIILAVFGPEGLGPLALAVLVEGVICALLGCIAIGISEGGAKNVLENCVKKILLHPLVWASLGGFAANRYWPSFTLPQYVDVFLSDVCIHAGLWVVGISLFEICRDKKASPQRGRGRLKATLVASIMRLVAFPLMVIIGGIVMGLPKGEMFVIAIYYGMATSPIGYMMTLSLSGKNYLHAEIMLTQIACFSPFTVGMWVAIYYCL
ncbi:MAG: hypothetical protein HY559_04670 [Gammaproteobacteria bacterium]|nr:hypothetical protein [Gammaproteobacteria bacterium]